MTEKPRNRRGVVVGATAVLVAAGLTGAALRSDRTPAAPAAAGGEHPHDVHGRVVVGSGGTVRVVDLATGRPTDVSVPAPVAGLRRVGGSVLLTTGAGPNDPGPVYVLRPDLTVHRLPGVTGAGPADPAGTGFWTMSLARGWDHATVTHHTLTGRVVSGPHRLPPATHLTGVYDGGLLLTRGEGPNLLAWDPATRRTADTATGVDYVATNTKRVVLNPALCTAAGCRLTWAAPPGLTPAPPCDCGEVRLAAPPVGGTPGRLSDDGRRLAVRTQAAGQPLAVCDLGSGRCEQVSGLPPERTLVEWVDGDTLVVDLGGGRLGVWQPGWDTPRPVAGEHHAESLAVLGP